MKKEIGESKSIQFSAYINIQIYIYIYETLNRNFERKSKKIFLLCCKTSLEI